MIDSIGSLDLTVINQSPALNTKLCIHTATLKSCGVVDGPENSAERVLRPRIRGPLSVAIMVRRKLASGQYTGALDLPYGDFGETLPKAFSSGGSD